MPCPSGCRMQALGRGHILGKHFVPGCFSNPIDVTSELRSSHKSWNPHSTRFSAVSINHDHLLEPGSTTYSYSRMPTAHPTRIESRKFLHAAWNIR
ncbi:hypothetical protein GDO78_009210 [Eleutherodactylus coqui]|uniref:Uncharacterized protein n=1 Tax=Eleutherodactylus coqui TaxID=57060 RepID=A0A8J6K706_ELECQ|nr:hypothetical protein GDO78_009210 [Eleutherodactylus coqui]